MDTIIEIAVGILGFGGAVMLFRLLKPKSVAKQNEAVIVKVNDLDKENAEALEIMQKILKTADDKAAELEKEKAKKLTEEETAEFFNNRNKLQ